MNKIRIRILHGIPPKTEHTVSGVKYTHHKINEIETIEIETPQILQVGDFVEYKNISTNIETRYYFPESDNFIFVAQEVWSRT
jgi:hypothetical protein